MLKRSFLLLRQCCGISVQVFVNKYGVNAQQSAQPKESLDPD